MKTANNTTNMSERRAAMYRFLARFYYKEADSALIKRLAAMRFAGGSEESGLFAGYGLLARWLQENGSKAGAEDELAADYARIFLAAGVADGEAAFPYESVYTSRKRIVMQEAWMDMRGLYRESGVHITGVPADCLEDHVGCELEYMAYLCSLGDGAAGKQQAFLENHLLNWLPAFTADVEKYAATDFYRAAAKLTLAFIGMDRELFSQPLPKEAQEGGRKPCASRSA